MHLLRWVQLYFCGMVLHGFADPPEVNVHSTLGVLIHLPAADPQGSVKLMVGVVHCFGTCTVDEVAIRY